MAEREHDCGLAEYIGYCSFVQILYSDPRQVTHTWVFSDECVPDERSMAR
jgi:hypothetical protein